MSQATSWVSHLAANPNPAYPNQGYCKEITDEFGKDLELVLGPKNIRVPYDQISQKEVEERLEKVAEKLFIQTRNSKQTMLASLQQLLRHLQDTKALWGIDLPIMNLMPMKGTQLHPIEMLWINYRSQRNIYARHIVQLIFKFDPYSVFNVFNPKWHFGRFVGARLYRFGYERTIAHLPAVFRLATLGVRTQRQSTDHLDCHQCVLTGH